MATTKATTLAHTLGGISSDISTAEINRLDNLTGDIQTQLDAKAPKASPTFTGTVAGVTKAHVGLGNVDNVADASQTSLGTVTSGTFNGTIGSSATITSGINMPNFTYNLSVGQKRTITIGPNQIIVYGSVNANGTGNSSAGTGIYGSSSSSGSPKVFGMWGYIAKNGTREDVGSVLAISDTLNVRDRIQGYFQGASTNGIGTGTLSPASARWSAQFNSSEDYELQLASADGGTFYYWLNIVTV